MSEGNLSGKIALVTGASKGIGSAIAERLANDGARVAINYNTNRESAEVLKKKLPGSEIFKADISKRDEVRNMVSEVHSKMGRIDIVVNNAGIMDLMTFEDFQEDRFEKMHRINVMGPIYTVTETLEDLKQSKSGRIINIASNAGVGTAAPGTSFYAITKAAVIMFTKRLAFDLKGTGVRVNAIAPGWIATDLTTGGKGEDDIASLKEFFTSRTTLGMYGNTGHIAGVAAFLASEDSDYISGQVIVADGGRMDNLTHSL